MYNSEDEFEPESGVGNTSKPWLSKSQGSIGIRKEEHNQTGNESKTGSRSILNTGHSNVTGFYTNSRIVKNKTSEGNFRIKKEKCVPDPTKPRIGAMSGINPEHNLLKTTNEAIKIETGADFLETARFSISTIASKPSGSHTLGSRSTGGIGGSDKSGTHGESSKQRTGASDKSGTHGESSKQRTGASDKSGTHGESSKQRTGASDKSGTHGEISKQRTGDSDKSETHGESSKQRTGDSYKSRTPVESYRKRPGTPGEKEDIKRRLLKLAEGDVIKGRSKKRLFPGKGQPTLIDAFKRQEQIKLSQTAAPGEILLLEEIHIGETKNQVSNELKPSPGCSPGTEEPSPGSNSGTEDRKENRRPIREQEEEPRKDVVKITFMKKEKVVPEYKINSADESSESLKWKKRMVLASKETDKNVREINEPLNLEIPLMDLNLCSSILNIGIPVGSSTPLSSPIKLNPGDSGSEVTLEPGKRPGSSSCCNPSPSKRLREELVNKSRKVPGSNEEDERERKQKEVKGETAEKRNDCIASTVQLQVPFNALHVKIPVQRPVLPENKNLLETAESQTVPKVASLSQSNTGADSLNPGVCNPEAEPVPGPRGRIKVRKLAYLLPHIDNPEGSRTNSNSGSSRDHPNPVLEAMDIYSHPSRSSSQTDQSFSGSYSELKDKTFANLARVISELREERIRIEENEKIAKENENENELDNNNENGEGEFGDRNENEDEDEDKMDKEEILNSSEYTEAEDIKDIKLGIKTL